MGPEKCSPLKNQITVIFYSILSNLLRSTSPRTELAKCAADVVARVVSCYTHFISFRF